MINFLTEYWRLILEAALIICSVVIFVLRKKPVKVIDTIKEIILRALPAIICLAEKEATKGSDKMIFVCAFFKKMFADLGYGDDIYNQYEPFIIDQAEAILTTPQKKER